MGSCLDNMHSSQSVEDVLLRSAELALISGDKDLVFVESRNFSNLLIVPLSVNKIPTSIAELRFRSDSKLKQSI